MLACLIALLTGRRTPGIVHPNCVKRLLYGADRRWFKQREKTTQRPARPYRNEMMLGFNLLLSLPLPPCGQYCSPFVVCERARGLRVTDFYITYSRDDMTCSWLCSWLCTTDDSFGGEKKVYSITSPFHQHKPSLPLRHPCRPPRFLTTVNEIIPTFGTHILILPYLFNSSASL